VKEFISENYTQELGREVAPMVVVGDDATRQEVNEDLVDYVIEKVGKRVGKSWEEQVQEMGEQQWNELAEGYAYCCGEACMPLLLMENCTVSSLRCNTQYANSPKQRAQKHALNQTKRQGPSLSRVVHVVCFTHRSQQLAEKHLTPL
jgi:hypothetical protein